MHTVPTFCGKDCGGNACPLLATIEDGRVTRVSINPAGGKYLKGCQRGLNLPLIQYAPDRILEPLIRSGPRGSGLFRPASWEEALQLTAAQLGEIRSQYGPQAVLNLGSAGSTSVFHGASTLLGRFLNLFGGPTRLTGNYSNGAASFALTYVLGPEWSSGFDPATMRSSALIILWGANVLETRMGTGVVQHLLEAKKRGCQIIVIDPRRTETVKQLATWWIQMKPGTDTALMLAVLHVLISEKLIDRAFIESRSTGFEQLERYVSGSDGGEVHNPLWAEGICGVDAEEITRFARAYGEAKPTALLPGYSIQRVFAGEETFRLAVTLQIATGNFGVPGGSTGSLNNRLPSPRVGKMDRLDLPNFPRLPILRWPDAILEGTEGGYPSDIHAIYAAGSNMLNQGSDIRKNIAAYEKVDFSVCHELFLTPTALYSDVVLPITTPLEREDIGTPWLGNYLLYKPQAVPPLGSARSDYDIFCDLAGRLGFQDAYTEGRSPAQWIEHFIAQSEIADPQNFRETGIYINPNQERVGLSEFSKDPKGYPLPTPSGKVEIASQSYASETGGTVIPTWHALPNDNRYPLQLITPKSRHFTHSQGTNIPELHRAAKHALAINPVDAAPRKIGEGDMVRIFNDHGSSYIPAHLTDEILRGVVCLPEGIWVELNKTGEDLAGSANMFSETGGTFPARACIMHGIQVEVEKKLPGF